MKDNTEILPLIPLRGLTIFPYMVLHFDVGRKKSVLALENAMINGQRIFLSSQKQAKTEEPLKEDIYNVGSICNIKQILKLPGDTVRVLVEGEVRAKITEFVEDDDEFLKVKVEKIEEEEIDNKSQGEAIARLVKESFEEYVKLSGSASTDILLSLEEIEKLGRLSDVISSYIILNQDQKQELIELYDPIKRLEKLLQFIKEEIDILKLEKKIGAKVKNKIDKLQKEYYLKEQLKAIKEELGDDDNKEIKEYENKIKKSKLPKEAKEKALYELDRLKKIEGYSSESGIIRTYIDWIISLPWSKESKDTLDIKKAKKILDNEHFGLSDVKDRIIEYLAVKKMSKTLKGPILCLVGPPGVGKTSIAKSIANSLNRNFVRISLGGVKDESEIRGHRKTYVGAIPGRIIYGMKQAKSKNPLFLLDEIDKMSNDFKGDPAGALLEVLDSEQNATFRDHYLELDFDLSNVLFITTANSLNTIPRPLLDRMEIIEVSGYTSEEKFHICKDHLIPKKLKEYSISKKQITFSDSSVMMIVDNYTRESGVRNLERKISTIIRKAIRDLLEKNKNAINVTVNHVKKYLGADLYSYEMAGKEDKVGVVMGLAWTAYGGDTLPVEVVIMPGSGKLQLTGKLGEVMIESAKAGYSYIRANASKYGINDKFYKEKDIHIHVPEGAVPKDGPSAGVTMITAMVSALSGRKIKQNVAMTGEITLVGRVLPIGGLKEKSLAAHRAGIDTIIMPKDNEKDLVKIPKTIKNKINFIPTDNIEDVLKNALI